MNSEWINCEIADLGDVVGGATPSTKKIEYYNGEIPWITPKDLSDHKSRFINRGERNITLEGLRSCSTQILPKNTVLFSSRAPIGYVAIAANDLCTNQGFKSVIPNDKTDFMFLFYLLKYNKDAIENMASGTTFKEVSGATMRKIVVRVPDLETQKRIAKVLSALDDKIELNNQINKNLEEQAQALYNSWFVDFEPFGRRRPTSWYMGILSDLANISTGKRPTIKSDIKTSEFCIPIVGASSVMGYTSKSNYNDRILVTGRVGTHGVIQRFSTACWASDNTLVITSNYYEYVNQILGKIDYSSLNRGSTQPLITQGDMNKEHVLIPDTETLNRFETIVGALMTSYDYNNNENMRLEEVRDSLLPKLMSGEINADNVEI